MATIALTENLTSPGIDPINGDELRITDSNGDVILKTYSSREIDLSDPPIRIISVGSFLDRMSINNKLFIIYKVIDDAKSAPVPDYTLYGAIENLKQRSYIDLDEPRLKPTLEALSLYTPEEITFIFADGIEDEEP